MLSCWTCDSYISHVPPSALQMLRSEKLEAPRKPSVSRAGLRTNNKLLIKYKASSANEWQASGRARQGCDLEFNPPSVRECVCFFLCSYRPADRPLLQTESPTRILQTKFKSPETGALATKRL